MLRPPPTLGRRKLDVSPTRAPGPVEPPVLVAAAYVQGTSVTLVFDRPVSIAGLIGAAVRVDDGDFNQMSYHGATATLADPTTVLLNLSELDAWPDPGVTLTADANNGIVALDGGAAWDGIAGLELPFEQ